jgi:hypothetical protein
MSAGALKRIAVIGGVAITEAAIATTNPDAKNTMQP